jgi:iron complex transport system permease protein
MTRKRSRYILFLLPAALLFFFCLDVLFGSVKIPLSEVFGALTGSSQVKPVWMTILTEFRIPKAITAVLAGSALSVCGLLMQTYFRNPLADPYVLGINSGASLGVAVVLLTTQSLGVSLVYFSDAFKQAGVTIAAIAGGAFTLFIVTIVARKVSNNITLLIVGLMMGYIIGSFESILKYYSTSESLQGYVIWGMGNFSNVLWRDLYVLIPSVLAGLIAAFLLSKPLNLLLLGENYAVSMGANIKLIRLLIIITGGALGGIITAFCGPIAFIGIAVPHITKNLLKAFDHKILIPAVAFTGSILALVCDLISQMPGNDQNLPINAVTSLIGAPIVIWIIMSQRKVKRSFIDE